MLDQIKLGMACHHGKLCSGDARTTIIVRMNTDAPRLFEKCQAVKPSKLPFQVLTRARQKALLLEQRPLGE